MEGILKCSLCGVDLISQQVEFSYMKSVFHHDFPKCPKCGQVFIPEDIVKGRMADVETELEDK